MIDSTHALANDEKAELHNTIWKIANDLRGSVDGWDFKQYILGTDFSFSGVEPAP